MSDQTVALTLHVAPSILEKLQTEAQRQDISIDELMRDVIETFLDEEHYEDTSDEEILDRLREGFADAFAGRTHPAREVLEEIRNEQEADADES